MDPRNLARLESLSSELAASIAALGQSPRPTGSHSLANGQEPDCQRQESVVRILSSLSAIRALVCGPTDFLENLLIQVIFVQKFMPQMNWH